MEITKVFEYLQRDLSNSKISHEFLCTRVMEKGNFFLKKVKSKFKQSLE